jgi:hypothetical protein
MVALSKVIRWEVGQAGEFDRALTPEEIMDRLESLDLEVASYSSSSSGR